MDTTNNGLPPLPTTPVTSLPGTEIPTMPAPAAPVPPAAMPTVVSTPPVSSVTSTLTVKPVTTAEQTKSGVKPVVVIILVLLALLVGFGIGFRLGGNATAAVPPVTGGPESTTACPTDAMVCPDGSSVGRVGPNCDFAPCPAATGEQGAGGAPVLDTGSPTVVPAP